METPKKEYVASAKFIRMNPYKVRRIARLVKRGMSYSQSESLLKSLPHRAAGLLSKVIKSAVYNAVNNHKEELQKLVIQSIHVDEGPQMSRFKARARGRINKIIKRSCHIRVTVETIKL